MAGIYYVVTSYIFDYEPGLILAEHRLRHLHKNDDRGRGGHSAWQGRTHGEGEGPGPPWDLKNTIFSGFLPLNYVICIFEVCFLCFLLCGRTEEACSTVNSLRKVDFSHPTGHYTWTKFSHPPAPLEKILGAPLPPGVCRNTVLLLVVLKPVPITTQHL